MNKILYWDYHMENLRESAIDMRSISAVNYHKKVLSDDDNFKKWVYNFRYDCLQILKKKMGIEISGAVLEIGAGTGIYSCIVSKNPSVEIVYALEYSKICVEELMVFIIKRFNLEEFEEKKIIPVVGSFNEIKLPDASVDFVIAMGALHHSEDREITIKEIYRVLKIGGYLIACERANYNYRTNMWLNKQIDDEYNIEMKSKMGYDVNEKITRRMNSEHVPILAEWEYLLTKYGFKNLIYWFLYFKRGIKSGMRGLIWHIFGKLFFKIFGNWLIKNQKTQIMHVKIPFYPWFSKSKNPDDILIIAKKEPYIKMP